MKLFSKCKWLLQDDTIGPLFPYLPTSSLASQHNNTTNLSFTHLSFFIFIHYVNFALSQAEKTLMKWHENRRGEQWNERTQRLRPGTAQPVALSLLIHKESNFWCFTGWSFVKFKHGGLARSCWALVRLNVTHSSLLSNRCLCANALKSLRSFRASSPFQHYVQQNDVSIKKSLSALYCSYGL